MAEVFPSRQERQRPTDRSTDGQPSSSHPSNTCTESDMNLLYECGMLDSSPARRCSEVSMPWVCGDWQKPTAEGSRRLMTRQIKELQYQVGKGSTQFKENPEYYFSPTLVLDPLG